MYTQAHAHTNRLYVASVGVDPAPVEGVRGVAIAIAWGPALSGYQHTLPVSPTLTHSALILSPPHTRIHTLTDTHDPMAPRLLYTCTNTLGQLGNGGAEKCNSDDGSARQTSPARQHKAGLQKQGQARAVGTSHMTEEEGGSHCPKCQAACSFCTHTYAHARTYTESHTSCQAESRQTSRGALFRKRPVPPAGAQ